jgi:hypothetical protein
MTSVTLRAAAAAAVIAGATSPLAASAQEALHPIVGATLIGEGADAFVFQCLLGASTQGGGFARVEEVAPQIVQDQTVRWFSLDGEQGVGTSHATVALDEPCTYSYTTDATLGTSVPGSYVGVGGDWPVIPGELSVESGEAAGYRDIAAAYFASIGHQTDRVTLTQVIHTDLEGDGAEEVLIVVTDDADGLTSSIDPGDHSAILVHRTVDGVEDTVLVDGEFYDEHHDFAAKFEFRVIAVVDLNGDGRSEIFAGADYYEGSNFVVYQQGADASFVEAMSCGCGA